MDSVNREMAILDEKRVHSKERTGMSHPLPLSLSMAQSEHMLKRVVLRTKSDSIKSKR